MFVNNQSKYNLELTTSNYNTGYPAYDVKVVVTSLINVRLELL